MNGLNTAYVFPTLVADPLRLVVISRRTRASPNCKFQNNFLFCMFVKTRILSNGILGLHLNKIWTPAYSPRKNIPGFVYVHIFFSVFTDISINSKSYACIFNFDQAYDEVVQISHLPCTRWAPIKLPFV